MHSNTTAAAGACQTCLFGLQFWTSLFWVTTADLLVRHMGMVIKVIISQLAVSLLPVHSRVIVACAYHACTPSAALFELQR